MLFLKKNVVVSVLFVVLLLCGCLADNVVSSDSLMSDQHSDHNHGDFYYYIEPVGVPADKIYNYNGGKLEVDLCFNSQDQEGTSYGLFVFLDGVPQRYSFDLGDGELSYLHEVKSVYCEDEEIYFSVSFEPSNGQEGDLLFLDFLIIVNPYLFLSDEDVDNHLITGMDSLFLRMNCDSKEQSLNAYVLDDVEYIDEKEIKSRILPNGKSLFDSSDLFSFYSKEDDRKFRTVDGLIQFGYEVSGAVKDNCKVIVFADHEPVKIDNKYDYLQYDLEQYTRLRFEGFIDTNSYDCDFIYAINIYHRTDSANNTNYFTKSSSFKVE